MNHSISRRDFLKIAGLSTGAAAVLTGCGDSSRYVRRQPYSDMPEYTQTGKSTYFATTCGECSAGCGLIVRTMEGRAHKVDGNRDHPVARGGTCSRGQLILHGLYNPDRLKGPVKASGRGSGQYQQIEWDAAVDAVKTALQNTAPDQIAFLLGLFPDHLYDLVQSIAQALGGAKVVRYGALAEFESRATLIQSAKKIFGAAKIPIFDIEHAETVFSFGANFVETWLSPVSFAFQYGQMRQGVLGERGYLVQFESRMSQTAANADEWYPIVPGSEAALAQGLARMTGVLKTNPSATDFPGVNLDDLSAQTGIAPGDLLRLAHMFAESPHPLALPGGIPLGNSNGAAIADAILALNAAANNSGQPGGILFLPDSPLSSNEPAYNPGSLAGVAALVDQMKGGQIKALFVHGVNPIYEIPKAVGFAEALANVPLVFSFASYPDETAAQADYVLPDHTPLESWGYQRIVFGSDRTTLSGLQPVVVPLYDTKPTADVLLAAVAAIGGNLAAAVPFADEVEFLQKTVAGVMGQGGTYDAPTPEAFWELWLQHGGWWKPDPDWTNIAANSSLDQLGAPGPAQFTGDPAEYPLYLLPFPHPNLGDGAQANRPILQETPDPMTTVMWDTWVEINPQTAQNLNLQDNDLVKIATPAGEIEAAVYTFPGIRPDVIAIPLGQGHSALGRYAQGRGATPQDLLANGQNGGGNLAFAAMRAKINPTGQRKALARYEDQIGVSGSPSVPQGG